MSACARPILLAIPFEKVPTGLFAAAFKPTISSRASMRIFRTPAGSANNLP